MKYLHRNAGLPSSSKQNNNNRTWHICTIQSQYNENIFHPNLSHVTLWLCDQIRMAMQLYFFF